MRFRHIAADFKYICKKISAWGGKVLGAQLEVPSNCPNRYSSVTVEQDCWITMRDGVRLCADVYRPKAEGKFPVVLIRMPYGKRETYCSMPSHGRYWAKKGYACVVQDVRGKWGSEGIWDPFVNEARDGYDTLDWVARQPWCDGNIGMTGESYYGYTQLAAATTAHPNLKCIAPGDTAANIYGVWVYNSFALCLQTMGIWSPETTSRTYANYFRLDPWRLPLISMDDDAGIPSYYYKEWVNRPVRDEYWEKINLDSHYAKIKIPVLSWGGWYDTFLKGTIDDWAGIRAAARANGVPDQQYLLIAGTDHEVTPMTTGRIGKLEVGHAAWSYDKILQFFDHFLKGIDNGVSTRGKVEIFTTGKNSWRNEENWPLSRTHYVKYYLHSQGGANTRLGDGTLSTDLPLTENNDSFTYDPARPVQVTLGENMWRRAECLTDRVELENRTDVLCYSTAQLLSDTEVTGPITATLFASTSAVDTDFTATLVDVFPDGYCHLVQEGIVRARYSEGNGKERLLEPGKVYEFEINLWSTSHVFKQGHQIRLEISSSNFDRYDRNLNNGERVGYSSRCVIATQKVFHDAAHPSCVVLPVIL